MTNHAVSSKGLTKPEAKHELFDQTGSEVRHTLTASPDHRIEAPQV